MLIIKSDANSLKGVEQFLKNRDWQLTSTHLMKNAVLAMVQSKPSFVLITVDHPNKKIQKLPKVIAASFPCCIMVYAEKATTGSFKLLADSGIEYKINPPITGPAIERAVNKYIRDREQAAKQKDSAGLNGEGKGSFEFQVEVKSSGQKESSMMSFKNGAASEKESAAQSTLAQSLLAQLGGEEGDEEFQIAESTPDKKTDNGNVITFGAKQKQGQEIDLDPEEKKRESLILQPGQKESDELKANQEGVDAAELMARAEKKQAKGVGGDINPDAEGRSGKDILVGSAQTKKKNNSAGEQARREASELYVPTEDSDDSPAGRRRELNARNSKDILIGQNKVQTPYKKVNEDIMKIRSGSTLDPESIFIKGVNKSLDDTVVKGNGEIDESLENNSHLACLIVESVRFSGYLVAALGKDKKMDDSFVDLIRMKLLKFLKENGESIDNESNMQLKVKHVDFEGWALEYAQFLRKSVHKGSEVAMAFFPYADVQIKFSDSAAADMVSVKMSEIQTDIPLEFNMYIYLATNKKYILYTPQGGMFLPEQKTRLSRQGMSQVHIKKDDVQNLGKFKAQNHLNSLISDYDKKTDPKKKAS